MSLISADAPYIQECPLKKICAWLDFLFTICICSLSDHVYSSNQVTPSFWFGLCANSRLCIIIGEWNSSVLKSARLVIERSWV